MICVMLRCGFKVTYKILCHSRNACIGNPVVNLVPNGGFKVMHYRTLDYAGMTAQVL